jgi:hypothetical protein
MDRLLSTSLFLVVALFWLAAPTRAQTEAEEPCANKQPSIGEYRNLHHGFSIVIPAGLKAYWYSLRCDDAPADCVCKTDEGRRIPLATGATINILAFYDAADFEFYPPNGEHNKILELRRNKHVSQVKRLRSGWFRLGDMNAYRYAIQFRRDKKIFIGDKVVVLYEHVVYLLSLQTTGVRYGADKKLFEEIIASWRWTQRIK